MKNIKKIMSILIAVALVLTAIPVGFVGTSAAASIEADASLVLNRPNASVVVSEITRVAYASNSMKAPSGNNSVIVRSTPSGMPYLSSSKSSLAYAGETPTATTIAFTPGVELENAPVLSCNNSTIKWSAYVVSNGTYTWTLTGGTAVAGTTLVFTVTYTYSDVNAVSGKTYTNTYTTSGTSYVEPIATPAGLYSTKRTYENWGLGTTTKNRSYVASYILGKNTYGSFYNNGTPDGSVAFGTSAWVDSAGWTDEYGMMKSMSGSDASRNFNVAFKADSNRPLSTVYYDTSINSTLSDLNLRAVTTNLAQASETDERVTVRMEDLVVLDGIVATSDDASDDISVTSDPMQATQLNVTRPTSNLFSVGASFTSYFTGIGPGTNNATTDYTVLFHYRTAAGWSDIYVDHNHSLRIITYNKGALRTLVESVQSSDPSVQITTLQEGDFKGYNPQSWYYSSGWESFSNALNAARACLDRPDISQAQIDTAYENLTLAYEALQLRTADYTIAGAYYNQAMNMNPANYTLASWARLQTILDNYRSDYSVLYQPAVDKIGMDIKAEMDSLEERRADYTEFNLLLASINNYMRTAMTTYGKPVSQVYAGWSNLEAVLHNAGCVYNELDGYTVEDYLLISEQAKLNGYVLLIERARDALRINGADYTWATEAENAYKIINLNHVVSEVAGNLNTAYNELVALHDLDLTRQGDIDAAVAELNYWLERVVYKPVDTTAAQALIATANSLDRTLYSDFSAVDAAIANLESKFSLDIRYQNEITRAMSMLQSAMDRLLANSADYTLVDEAIAAVADEETRILETYESTYGYTVDTFYSNWSNVTTAVANVVRGLDVTHQTQVNSYATAINNALNGLQENTADYTELAEIQAIAYNLCTNNQLYTAASINNLLNVYMSVQNNLPISQQATVDGYEATIQQAIDDLEYLPADYMNLNAQISIANEKIAADLAYTAAHPGYSLYTNESLTNVEVALAAVVENLDLRYQDTVDTFEADIIEGISNLTYAPADYTAVYEALAAVPSDTSIYTTLSLATLNTVTNNINYNYTADKQTTVDKYVTNINTALGKLKLKTANYTAVNNAIAAVPSNSSVYTEDSWQALQDQINAVVTGLDITHQSEVDTFAENINTALTLLAFKGADYSGVEEAKAEIPADLSIYSEPSVAALEAALDAVDYYCNINQQSTVDGYAAAIRAAVAGLSAMGANYSAVEAAITAANAKIDSGLYTNESVAAVQNAINAVVEGLDITRQGEVDAFAQAINTAAGAMEYKPASYSAVEEAITAANAKIDSELYTNESVDVVQSAINAVVEGLDITHQGEVDAFAQAINTAAGQMEYKPANYSAVEAAITAANAKIDSGLYTNESVTAVQSAINAVVEGLDITHQGEVDAFAQAINTAAGQMEYKPASYSAVEEAITAANAKIDSGLYTGESVAAVQNAINAVEEGYDITRQGEVDAFAQAINTAAGQMEYKPASYSAVEEAITAANAKINSGLYTNESVDVVQSAINAVVEGLDITHQGEVDAFAQAINTAAGQMEYKPASYSAVEEAITAANAKINSGLYTSESVTAVQSAINAVVEGLDITHQGEVDAFAQAINTAAGQMEYKPADYEALNEANSIATEKIATGWYTEETVAALEVEMSKIVANLDITHQSEIDEWEFLIVKATKDLVLKLANYTELQNILNLLDNSSSEIYTITYRNYDEVMALIEAYRSEHVDMTVTIDRQSEVDLMAETLQGYIDMLDPTPIETFEFINGAEYFERSGVKYVRGLKTLLTRGQLLNNYINAENVTVSTQIASGTRYLGTGSVITVTSDATGEVIDRYIIIIYGDVNRNGSIDASDVLYLNDVIGGNEEMTSIEQSLAANVFGTRATVDAQDLSVISSITLGEGTINQLTGKA